MDGFAFERFVEIGQTSGEQLLMYILLEELWHLTYKILGLVPSLLFSRYPSQAHLAGSQWQHASAVVVQTHQCIMADKSDVPSMPFAR